MNKKSWHFRLVSMFFSDFKWQVREKGFVQLCPYARALVFSIALMTGIVLLATLAGFVIGLLMIASVLPHLFGGIPMDMSVLGAILWTGLALITWKATHEAKPSWDKVLYTPKPKEYVYKAPKEPSVFTLYLRAMHDKMCPKIEVK